MVSSAVRCRVPHCKLVAVPPRSLLSAPASLLTFSILTFFWADPGARCHHPSIPAARTPHRRTQAGETTREGKCKGEDVSYQFIMQENQSIKFAHDAGLTSGDLHFRCQPFLQISSVRAAENFEESTLCGAFNNAQYMYKHNIHYPYF